MAPRKKPTAQPDAPPPLTPVQEKEVFNACDAIAGRGERVTLRNVRKELGDRGSMSTLSSHIAAWRGRNSAGEGLIPLDLRAALVAALQAVHQAGGAGAADTIADLRDVIASLEKEGEILRRAAADAQQAQMAARMQAAAAEAQVKELRDRVVKLEKDIDWYRSQIKV